MYRSLRLETLADYVFFIDVVHVPPVHGDARAASPPSQWTHLMAGVVSTFPSRDRNGQVGSGLHGAEATNVLLGVIDAAAAAVMPEDDDAGPQEEWYEEEPPAAFDPRGEFYRGSPNWWDTYDRFQAGPMKPALSVMRRTDGAVACLSTPGRPFFEMRDLYEGDEEHNWAFFAPVGDFVRSQRRSHLCEMRAYLSLRWRSDEEDATCNHPWAALCPAYDFSSAHLYWDVWATRHDDVARAWETMAEDVLAMLCLLDWQEAP
jgi:hypothetical protein